MDSSEFVKKLAKHKFILPPLSGYTDYPFRKILAKSDSPFIITEMVSAQAVIHENKKTMQILKIAEGKYCKGVQLFGSDPEIMGKAASIVQGLGFDYIDINMGCTIKKVVNKGAGICLMKNEELASLIAGAVVDSVDIPVTCKIRLGLTKTKMNGLDLSKKLSDVGVAAIAVHGRTGEKKFAMKVDYGQIKEIVDNVPIPIIANGSVFNADDAKKMMEKTNAAAVMPGRGIIGNPWIVNELESAFSNTKNNIADLKDRKEICQQHLDHLTKFYGLRSGVLKMRRILPHYFPKCLNLRELKLDVHQASYVEEINEMISKIKEVDNCISYDK